MGNKLKDVFKYADLDGSGTLNTPQEIKDLVAALAVRASGNSYNHSDSVTNCDDGVIQENEVDRTQRFANYYFSGLVYGVRSEGGRDGSREFVVPAPYQNVISATALGELGENIDMKNAVWDALKTAHGIETTWRNPVEIKAHKEASEAIKK